MRITRFLAFLLCTAFLTFLAHLPRAAAQSADTTTSASQKQGLPLEPGRRISFETQKGSWMSLDVSRDGERMIFELLGDLYTLPMDGGEAERVTSGMAFDSQPRFSPDGERVLFVSDRSGSENLWAFELGGTDTTQITRGTGQQYQSPEWTPNGEYVVASRSAGLGVSKLWLFSVEGGSGMALVKKPENLKMMGAAFGDDPRYIWYAERTGSWDYNAQLPQYQLAVYDRETGERYERSSRFGSAFRPTLSPDGRWLVYGTRHDGATGLRLRNLDTGAERWLAYPVQRDDQESRATRDVLPGMAFTPDSEALVASYGGTFWRLPVEEGADAEKIPFTADVNLPVGPKLDFEYPIEQDPTFTARQIRGAVPSPSGDRLAFTALDQLYVMDYPGGSPRRIADMGAGVSQHSPSWSPDGEWIAFVTWSEDGGGHIRRVRTGGGPQQMEQLTQESAFYRDLAWSPDGERVEERIVAVRSSAEAFEGGQGGTGSDLVWLPSGGGETERVTPAGDLGDPHFTNDADRIYAYHEEDGLVSMRWDGTDVEQHLKVTGGKLAGADEPITASTVRMGPEGEQALAQVVNDLYVVDVPYTGGETPTVSVANPESASFPVRKLTEVGGQFPTWGPEGRTAHWSIGNAHFSYDLEEARRMEKQAENVSDETAATAEQGYEPVEERIEITARRDLPEGTAVLRGARIITMNEGEVIENGAVVIEDNRIAAVGEAGNVEMPDGAEVIDVSGKTIMPGIVDVHAHLRPPSGVHKTQVWEYLANLAYGVTTTHDPQTGTTDVLTYGDLVRSGELLGPRVYSTGPGIFRNAQVDSLGHARDILRRYSKYYDTKTIKMYLSGNRRQRQWIVQAAREQRITPTTEGGLDLKLNLTQIIDGYPGHEHNFPIYPLYRDVVQLAARTGVMYNPTLLVTYGGPWAENYFYTTRDVHGNEKLSRFTPHHELDQRTLQRPWFHEMRQAFDEHAQFVDDLVDAGGRAGVGGHGQLQGLGTHWELWAMASGGLSNHDALRAATRFGAEFIGRQQDLGSIEEGKLADLIVLNENPLEDLQNTTAIQYVMKGGRLYDGETLNEVYPRERELEPQWWEGRTPQQRLPGLSGTN